jgi:acyl carrier protein
MMLGHVSQAIEVLVLKAAVDPAFRSLLLEDRAKAAASIGLELGSAESALLASVPQDQLAAIIARSTVPQEHRRAFLGQAAAAMLAAVGALGAGQAIAGGKFIGGGGTGIRPDKPAEKPDEKTDEVQERVIGVVARQLKADTADVTPEKTLVKDLGAKSADLSKIRQGLEKEFKIKVPGQAFKKVRTVGDAVDGVKSQLEKQPPPPMTFGIRPDAPPASGLGGMRPR